MAAFESDFSNERIAKNEAQTATANARAAEAEQRAVEARLELENYRAMFSIRADYVLSSLHVGKCYA